MTTKINALTVVSDTVPGLRNALRSTCHGLRSLVPAVPERVTDVQTAPPAVAWMTSVMSGEEKEMATATLVRAGSVEAIRAIDGLSVNQSLVKLAVASERLNVLEWLRTNYRDWTDESALALCIRLSKFELVDKLGLRLTSSAYIHAAASNNVEAIEWLARRKVTAAHNLASFAASHGNVEAMERILDLGIGGCQQVAFRTACNRKRVNVLEALWRRGCFDNYVFAAALKSGDAELMDWGKSKQPVFVEPRHLIETLVQVIKRDDLEAYVYLYKTSPYHCLSAPMLEGVEVYGAEQIAAYLDTQYRD